MYNAYGYGQQGDGFASYGATPGFEQQQPFGFDQPLKSPFVRQRKTNVVAILSCLLLPCFIFAAVDAVLSFSVHYSNESLSQLVCFALLAVCGLFGYFAFMAVRRRTEGVSEPAWYVLLFVTSIIAWGVAYALGGSNFKSNMKPYFDVQQLNVYTSVDPDTYRGTQLMDAGRITFTPGSHLEISRSMGFRNLDTYCVAPIVGVSGANMSSYDFWAIGINCCSGHAPDFHCGEYDNPRAHSGLRLMRDDHRSYFRLAVEQAEAAYGLQAKHPIFLYWMQEPLAEVNAYQDDGYKNFIEGLGIYCAAQFVVVVIAAVVFSRMYG